MSAAPSYLQNSRPVFAGLMRMTDTIKSTVKGKKVVAADDVASFGCGDDWSLYYDADCNPKYSVGEFVPKTNEGGDDEKVVVIPTKPKYPTDVDEFGCLITTVMTPPPIPASYTSTAVPTSLAALFSPPIPSTPSTPSSISSPSYPHSPSFYSASTASLSCPSSESSHSSYAQSYTPVLLDQAPVSYAPSPLSSVSQLPSSPGKFERFLENVKTNKSLRFKSVKIVKPVSHKTAKFLKDEL